MKKMKRSNVNLLNVFFILVAAFITAGRVSANQDSPSIEKIQKKMEGYKSCMQYLRYKQTKCLAKSAASVFGVIPTFGLSMVTTLVFHDVASDAQDLIMLIRQARRYIKKTGGGVALIVPEEYPLLVNFYKKYIRSHGHFKKIGSPHMNQIADWIVRADSSKELCLLKTIYAPSLNKLFSARENMVQEVAMAIYGHSYGDFLPATKLKESPVQSVNNPLQNK